MNTKGTINLEYLITIMVLIMISLTIVALSQQEFESLDQTQNRKDARLVSLELTRTINNVYAQGNAFSQKYTLPDKINNETYIVKINTTGVYINSHYQITYNNYMASQVVDQNTNSQTIYLTPGNTYQFTNINNKIEVHQI